MIRVLLVDDQQLVRSGFRTILESDPGITVVGEAADGEAAVELAKQTLPNVICMDVEMPRLDGIGATARILEAARSASGGVGTDAQPSVLVLTTFGHERYLLDALAAGASGFLLKTSRAEQLIDAIYTLARGDALLGPDVTRTVIDRVTQAERGADEADANLPARLQRLAESRGELLTERELDVFCLLAVGKTNGEIAAELFLGESTIKTHVSNLLAKLRARDRVQLVVWAYTARPEFGS